MFAQFTSRDGEWPILFSTVQYEDSDLRDAGIWALGAIRYMLGEKAHDTVKDGSSEHVRSAGAAGPLSGDVEVGNVAFMSFPVLVGSYAQVAEKIDAISAETDVEGMLFSWPDWVPGIRSFGEEIIPRLECRKGWDVESMGGLRGEVA